ncbi:MAG: Eco57I restriction-modification methylase domain-containing protein [Candidatus Thorarchaeota archaeon]
MVSNKKFINSKDIAKFFGLSSKFYYESIKYFEKKILSKKKEFEAKFQQWNKTFKKIFSESESLSSDLFLKHTYFALLLKSLIIIKLSFIQNIDFEECYDDCKNNNLEAFNLFEFGYFYNWTNFNKKLFEKIYSIIEFTSLAYEDLFLDIYQQIFFTITRHKIGEFYTPSNLVRKMVDDFYNVGLKVLDPACGSGNFLIEIIVKILNSENPNKLKQEAINNVFGFDINPLATMTAKINILLIFLEYFDTRKDILPNINVYVMDSLFPQLYENLMFINLKNLYNSFDLIIGNPPWLTYKDINDKDYQIKIRDLAEEFGIKPLSQYITHIEIATLFFYTSTKFLKFGGNIFFVITKSVLNGDHCYKFRSFSLFNNIEIWDFPTNYFFNINHICLKAEYIGKDNEISIKDKYPIKAKVFNDDLEFYEETYYSSLKIENKGVKLILPENQLKILNKISVSQYKNKFFQGATLVPRTLVFFQIDKKDDNYLEISTDPDIYSRAKKNWKYYFQNKKIEALFQYKTFLNKDLIPFLLKRKRNVFLPVNNQFIFNFEYLNKYTYAMNFYNEMNDIYQAKKKKTSNIETLFSNLNYWNKLSKQIDNKNYMIVYNASGSNLKAAVINNLKNKIVVGSENYYFSTDSKEEAYYLCAILNTPILSKNIKLIKSSRHIHKRPFSFPIPLYDETNDSHKILARKAIKCESIVKDLFMKNPDINTEKVKIFITQKLNVLNDIVDQIVFNY